MEINMYISIVALNVSGLNTLVKDRGANICIAKETINKTKKTTIE